MPAMVVKEKPLTSEASRLNSGCRDGSHSFPSNAPPGTLCSCGIKARIYVSCGCGAPKPEMRDAVNLLEDYHNV